jgi:glycosyltransferase involved in cell wall biosynthesis
VALAGTGELLEGTKEYCKSLGLENNVKFLGFLKDPHTLMKNAGVMLMSSRWEGTPMCALEAQALGLPVVSTAVDGLVDMIENGVNGYLEEDNDSIAKHIVDILTDEGLRNTLSQNSARMSRERNDMEEYKRKIGTEYEKSISNNNNIRRR